MRKGTAVFYMEKGILVFLVLLLFFIPFILIENEKTYNQFTGKIVRSLEDRSPSIEDKQCILNCVSVGCELEDRECMLYNEEKCRIECDINGKLDNYPIEDLLGWN